MSLFIKLFLQSCQAANQLEIRLDKAGQGLSLSSDYSKYSSLESGLLSRLELEHWRLGLEYWLHSGMQTHMRMLVCAFVWLPCHTLLINSHRNGDRFKDQLFDSARLKRWSPSWNSTQTQPWWQGFRLFFGDSDLNSDLRFSDSTTTLLPRQMSWLCVCG